MKCVDTFESSEAAAEARGQLARAGIASRMTVDPLASIAPALGHFDGLAVMVSDDDVEQATSVLRQARTRRAS